MSGQWQKGVPARDQPKTVVRGEASVSLSEDEELAPMAVGQEHKVLPSDAPREPGDFRPRADS